MQANNISVTQKGEVHGLKNTAVHELNQIRAEALNDIDELEGGFSCVVASLSLSLSLLPRLFTVAYMNGCRCRIRKQKRVW